MPDQPASSSAGRLPHDPPLHDSPTARFRTAWESGIPPRLDDYLADLGLTVSMRSAGMESRSAVGTTPPSSQTGNPDSTANQPSNPARIELPGSRRAAVNSPEATQVLTPLPESPDQRSPDHFSLLRPSASELPPEISPRDLSPTIGSRDSGDQESGQTSTCPPTFPSDSSTDPGPPSHWNHITAETQHASRSEFASHEPVDATQICLPDLGETATELRNESSVLDVTQVANEANDPGNTQPDWTGSSSESRRIGLELLACELEFRWRNAAEGLPEGTVRQAADDGVEKTEVFDAAQTGVMPPSENSDLHADELIERFPQFRTDDGVPVELIAAEYRARQLWADRPSHAEYSRRFPGHSEKLSQALSQVDCELVSAGKKPFGTGQESARPPVKSQPKPEYGPSRGSGSAVREPADIPVCVGRYAVHRLLATGGFGRVFLAEDEQLRRMVAIKVLRRSKLRTSDAINDFLTEARVAAALDHPGIVRIFDIGSDADNGCFVVMEFLTGGTLEDRFEGESFSPGRLALLMAEICDAVHHAHVNHLIHRDLKPANILFGSDGRARVADFGLALKTDGPALREGHVAGTPLYMAPEQASGETHRLDPRTDVWSLGVILYRALAGRFPFSGPTSLVVLEKIQTQEPSPLLEVNPTVPVALDRIVSKCLQKRMSDRYASAAELAGQLRWIASAGAESLSTAKGGGPPIVPRGLRSFNARDAEFFLRLLPGPVDREGIPESIGRWRERIESRIATETFPVGLLYGPTGCGKSSWVRAGLLPLVAPHVSSAWLEAKPEGTEELLLQTLYRLCPRLPAGLDLPGAALRLREGHGLPTGQKICLFIDQFEQWLHTHPPDAEAPLVRALRQCDGVHLQCVLMVRDDFWLAISRFFRDLELPLQDGLNSGLVDLFDRAHAERVLGEFGRSYRQVEQPASAAQRRFIHQAIGELLQEGVVIPVRLAMFAEMMKNRPWSSDSLRDVGGTTGLGARFLEETFLAPSARPEHRSQAEAAQKVLQCLLPAAGTDIKGGARSANELRAVAGLDHDVLRFQELLRILDNELKLITPVGTDQFDEMSTAQGAPATAGRAEASYQLAHDYLVPSLRDWLTRQQRQTRQGRARLRLAELTDWWSARPTVRNLPGPVEWLGLRTAVRARDWRESERQMMRAASRFYLTRSVLAGALLVTAGLLGWWQLSRVATARRVETVQNLVGTLMRADVEQVPAIVSDLAGFGSHARERLQTEWRRDNLSPAERRNVAVGLERFAAAPSDFLQQELLTAPLEAFPVIQGALGTLTSEKTDWFRKQFRDPRGEINHRLRAAMAVASQQTNPTDWTATDLEFLARTLVTSNADQQRTIRQFLAPLGPQLIVPLRVLSGDSRERDTVRESASLALADFGREDLDLLVALICEGTAPQAALLEPRLLQGPWPRADVVGRLLSVAKPLDTPSEQMNEALANGRRRAHAAIAALRLGARVEALTVFSMNTDPEALTQFVHACRERGVTTAALLDCLSSARDTPARFGLILALGEYTWEELPSERKDGLTQQLQTWHQVEPHAGLHAASGWLLARWKQPLPLVGQGPLPQPQPATISGELSRPDPGWMVQRAGEDAWTMVIHHPRQITVGSPADEPDRNSTLEALTTLDFGHTWAIADREVTRGQYERYLRATGGQLLPIDPWTPTASHPMNAATWFEVVQYCRWLTIQAGFTEADQCYADPTAAGIELTKFAEGMEFPRDWKVDISKPGFRLPLEAEWEHACRAGTTTAYSFGNDARHMRHYGWFLTTSQKMTQVGGQLRPNLGGLFDIHGNVLEFCSDWLAEYPTAELPDALKGQPGNVRVYRGGAWDNGESRGRSARRDGIRPIDRLADCGIRLVRTLVPAP